MIKPSKRATIYLDPKIHRILKIKALETDQTVSDLVNEALRHELTEDQADLEDIKNRANEPTISFESLLNKLKLDGKI